MRYVFTVLITLLAVYAAGCPRDYPPKLSLICTLDGIGGGDCSDSTGVHIYKAPSEMTNYWATTQTDAENLVSWCYGVSQPVAKKFIAEFVSPYKTTRVQ